MCHEIARKYQRKTVVMNGEELEEVKEYIFLDRLLTPGNLVSKEIDQRKTS